MENEALRTARGYCNKIGLTIGHITRNTQSNEKGETRSVRQHQWPNALSRRNRKERRKPPTQHSKSTIAPGCRNKIRKASQTSSTACVRAPSKQPNEGTHSKTNTNGVLCKPRSKLHTTNSVNTWRTVMRHEADHIYLGKAKHIEGVLKSTACRPRSGSSRQQQKLCDAMES